MSRRLLRWLRIPERPSPPPGSGDDLVIFHASPRFFWYSVWMWFPAQAIALFGLFLSLTFFGSMDGRTVETELFDEIGGRLAEAVFGGLGAWFILAIRYLEVLAIGVWAFQLVFTGALMKLAWEMRWYMVGDETLRVREGLWTVREQTMTIARIQNMAVHQGPVQKLFEIADLEIHAAGGGSGGDEATRGQRVVRFRGLDDAEGLRDRILVRLKAHRGAGLGDADDQGHKTELADLAAAARELHAEAWALRQVVAAPTGD